MNRPRLYLATVRHLRPAQIAWRLRYRAGDALGLRPRVPNPAAPPPWDAAALDRVAAWTRLRGRHLPPPAGTIAGLRAGRFTFQGETVGFGEGMPPWDRADLPRLWRYHLHYFECAREFAAEADPADGARLLGWMRDWIARNALGADVAWDAFPTSQRLLHWAVAEAVFRFDDAETARAYARQAAWLARRIEFDTDGNHLLKNAAALAAAAAVQPGAGAPRDGLALLRRCCAEQILPDGGHYERSPMYHLHVLDDLLLVRAAIGDAPAWLDDTLARMLRFLAAILHPDGDIPLFNDAARDPALPGAGLLAAGRGLLGLADDGPPPADLPDSGFHRLGDRAGPGSLIAHFGPIGPDHQPGHAHGGLLGFELSVGGARMLVDSGVHGYAGSPWRAYCRSTRAHNTVSVDGRDAIEPWGVFRVGRRAHGVLDRRRDGHLHGHHDGFAPHRHFRTIDHPKPGVWEIWDEIVGPGSVSVECFLHAPPEARVLPDGDNGDWRIEAGGAAIRVQPFGCDGAAVAAGAEDPMQGWHCPAFGVALPAPTLILRASGPAPLRIGCRITVV